MRNLKDYINYIMESADVYAVQDNTGAILNVFPTKEEADKDVKNWPDEAGPKVIVMKKSDIEK